MSEQRFYIDGMAVTPKEAAMLVVHHLRLAAMFFDPVGDDEDPDALILSELNRQLLEGDKARDKDGPEYLAGIAFIKAITDYFHNIIDDYS